MVFELDKNTHNENFTFSDIYITCMNFEKVLSLINENLIRWYSTKNSCSQGKRCIII